MGGCVGEPEQGWEHDEVTGGGVVGPSLSAVLNVCGDGCEELFGGVDLLDVSRTIGAGSWPSTWVALNTTNEPRPSVELHRRIGLLVVVDGPGSGVDVPPHTPGATFAFADKWSFDT